MADGAHAMRKTSTLILTGLLAASLIAAPAAAQFGPPAMDAETTVVEELVVRAIGGPAWWKVADADTTVYILASPGPLPKDLSFDQTTLQRRLTGANQVILPPEVDFGPMVLTAIPGALAFSRELENKAGKTTMEASLSPDVRARFVAAREKIGKPATRYGALKPGAAGMALVGDYLEYERKGQPDDDDEENSRNEKSLESIVKAAARSKRVRTAPAANLSGGSLLAQGLGDMRRLPLTPCLTFALDAIERGLTRPQPRRAPDYSAARAWAEGDVRPLIEAQRRGPQDGISAIIARPGEESVAFRASGACARSIPTVQGIGEKWIAAETTAVAGALRRKGHAVAVIEVSSLLMKDGVLDRLRRQGFTVTPPSGAEA